MAGRPGLRENEDELLRMQEEFFAGKLGPASSLVASREHVISEKKEMVGSKPDSRSLSAQERTFLKPVTETRKRQSLFAERRQAVASVPSSEPQTKPLTGVLAGIVERNVSNMKALPPQAPQVSSFPTVMKMDKQILLSRNSSKSRSLFAQQLAPCPPLVKEPEMAARMAPVITTRASILQGSAVVGDTEVEQIHQENLHVLASLSEAERAEERHKLLGSLDPQLVSFLQSKRQNLPKKTAKLPNTKKVMPIPEYVTAKREETLETEVKYDLPIPEDIVKDGKWVRLGIVERDKLKWMAPLSEPSSLPTQVGYVARFDFQGNLLAYDAPMDVTEGLHHHGEEPERAGYTVTELLHLSRSSLLQQRILALNTLGNILKMTKEGRYDECFDQPLLPTLMDASLLFAFRFALDDEAPTAVFAAVAAMKQLLVSDADEVCLERVYTWRRGDEQPSLPTEIDRDAVLRAQFEKEKSELKDVELGRIDVIRTCLRIDLLPRLRYVLEVLEPPATVIKAALDVVIRVIRHSREGAETIIRCPRLLDVAMGLYFPSSSSVRAFSGPFREALKLMRLLMSWEADISRNLLRRYPNFLPTLLTYITIDLRDLNVPSQEGLLLGIEIYHTLRVLLAYNMAANEFKSLEQVFVRQLYYYAGNVSVTTESENESNVRYSHVLGSAFLRCLEAAVSVTGSEGSELEWTDVEHFLEPLHNCLSKWLTQGSSGKIGDSASALLAAALDLLTSFYMRVKNSRLTLVYEDLERKLEALRSPCQTFVQPSGAFASSLAKMNSYSVFLSKLKNGTQRDSPALPSLGAVTLGQAASPILAANTPFPLLQAFLRLSNEYLPFQEIGRNLLGLQKMKTYMKKIISCQPSLLNHWFARFEVHVLYEMTSLSKENGLDIALTVLKYASTGDDWLVMRLMQDVIFRAESFDSKADLHSGLQEMSLELDEDRLESGKRVFALETLKETGGVYKRLFFEGKDFSTSRAWHQRLSPLAQLTCVPAGMLLPADWPYYPILQLHHAVVAQPLQQKTDIKDTFDREAVLAALRWVTLLQAQGKLMEMEQSGVGSAALYCRLSCIFLASESWFLDNEVASLMWFLLKRLGRAELDFEKPIPGIDSFPEFYGQLLEEYEAISYGHPLFGAWILLPLQCRHDPKLRLLFWGQHSGILRNFPLLPSQIPASMKSFCEPAETHPELLLFYSRALISGQLTRDRSPVLYVIAEQHLRQWVVREPSHVMAHKLASFWSSQRAVNP